MITLREVSDFIKMCAAGDWSVDWALIVDVDYNEQWITINMYLGDLVSGTKIAYSLGINIFHVNAYMSEIHVSGFTVDTSGGFSQIEYSQESYADFYAWIAMSNYSGGTQVKGKKFSQMDHDYQMNEMGMLDKLGHNALRKIIREAAEDA